MQNSIETNRKELFQYRFKDSKAIGKLEINALVYPKKRARH